MFDFVRSWAESISLWITSHKLMLTAIIALSLLSLGAGVLIGRRIALRRVWRKVPPSLTLRWRELRQREDRWVSNVQGVLEAAVYTTWAHSDAAHTDAVDRLRRDAGTLEYEGEERLRELRVERESLDSVFQVESRDRSIPEHLAEHEILFRQESLERGLAHLRQLSRELEFVYELARRRDEERAALSRAASQGEEPAALRERVAPSEERAPLESYLERPPAGSQGWCPNALRNA